MREEELVNNIFPIIKEIYKLVDLGFDIRENEEKADNLFSRKALLSNRATANLMEISTIAVCVSSLLLTYDNNYKGNDEYAQSMNAIFGMSYGFINAYQNFCRNCTNLRDEEIKTLFEKQYKLLDSLIIQLQNMKNECL